MRKKQRDAVTLPHISGKSAAAFWGIGIRKWADMLERGRYGEIRSFKSERGMRYVLIDVIEAAFPDADGLTQYGIAYQYLRDDRAKRAESFGHQRSGGST